MLFSTLLPVALFALSASAALDASSPHGPARALSNNHRRHHAKQSRSIASRESMPDAPLQKRCKPKSSSTPAATKAASTSSAPAASSTAAPAAAVAPSPTPDASGGGGYASKFGVSSDAMIVNEISLGFLPDFTESSISSINALLPKPMGVVGDYISVTPQDLSMGNLQWHKSDLLAQKTPPVYMATIMPASLSSWDSTQADAVAESMANLTAQGVPTWVRFAYEMNGCPAWNAWGCDPSGFQTAWAIMAASLRAKAPQAKMLWSPNVWGNPPNYDAYYPVDDDTVDLVGLSLYSYGDGQDQNTMPGADLFVSLAEPFYNTYSGAKNKPFVVAETSAPYHYFQDTTTPEPGGASEYDMKTQWLNSLTSSATHAQFPNMIAAVWFNYKKDEKQQTLDHRAVLGNSQVQGAVAALVG